uniref:NADH dehydrogenase subunit 3 n=1 Tax=Synelmis amoureuxi TaxID=3053537 RepID=UPI0030E12785
MQLFMISTFIATILPALILMTALVLQMRTMSDREKSSPFECGFDPKSNARIPFSMRFFLLAVIFLVFDIEIALLIPLPFSIKQFSLMTTMIGATLFILILIIGLLHEWREGSLDWTE